MSLTDEQHALVDRLVDSGRYASASEVIRDGLRLLQEKQESLLLDLLLIGELSPEEKAAIDPGLLERVGKMIRATVRQGLEEARRGELTDGEAHMARWKARLEAAVSAQEAGRRAKHRSA